MDHLVRNTSLATLLAISGLLVPSLTPAAEAASCVKIYRIYYDSPGSDTRTNTSLNGEWIQLQNICGTAKNLNGYKLRDAASHWYQFTSSFTLGAGAKVKIHTGKGTNTSTDRYWGSSSYIWNNDRDTAYLYNGAGTLLRTCAYNSTAVDYKYC